MNKAVILAIFSVVCCLAVVSARPAQQEVEITQHEWGPETNGYQLSRPAQTFNDNIDLPDFPLTDDNVAQAVQAIEASLRKYNLKK